MKDKILFLVHTEYHMMVTLSLIADIFINKDKYLIDIYQIEEKHSNRFKFEKNIDLLPNLNYKTVQYNGNDLKCKTCSDTFINTVLKENYSVFIMFNHHITLPVFLAKQLYKQGTEIHLAPDGAKVYVKSRITPRWSLLMALEYWKFIKYNRLPFSFYIPTLKYASLKVIKSVYIQFPKAYNNRTNKEVIKFKVLSSRDSIDLNHKFFNFKINEELSDNTKVIFYINQPIKQSPVLDFEVEILKELKNRFKEYTIIIKLHPLSKKEQIEKFRAIKNVKIISKTYPAELYIAAIKDSIVLSFWSTACLINNTKTRVYWLSKILENNNLLFNNLQLDNPTSHIKVIEKLEELI